MDVDDRNEVVAAAKPWEERLAPAQREPAHAETEAPTKPADKSRAINRRTKERSRAPAPTAADKCPAAVVVRRKTPRLIAHPGPSPRSDPVPVAVAIRRPVRADTVRIPHVPVLRFLAPSAMIIEVVIARDVARNVISRSRAVLFQVALFGPLIESVGTRRPNDAVRGIIFCAVEFRLFASTHVVSLSSGSDFAVTANHSNTGGVADFIYIDAKRAGLPHVENRVWRIHFVDVALAQLADPEIHRAFGNAHLRDALIEIEKRKSGHAAEMESGFSRLQFGAGILVDPNLVADGHRAVLGCASPIALSAGLQRHGAFDDADARHTLGRIFGRIVIICAHLRRKQNQQTRNAG